MRTHHIDLTRSLAAAFFVALSAARPLPAQVTFDWATVGNPGNAADTLTMNKGPAADNTTGYGAVGYTYRMSKYDVTNSQYVQFLNAVDPWGSNLRKLYSPNMGSSVLGAAYTGGIDLNANGPDGAKYSVKSGQGNFPAIWVRWDASARFVNWLANGQGSGGTESGVYDMSVLTSGFATPPTRAANATVFLPSENEYYKAAYYDPAKGGIGGYWRYGTRSDTAPASVAPPGTGNAANIGTGSSGGGGTADTMAKTGAAFSSAVNYLTAVGAYTTATSAYGLYDVEGLVYNWTEATRTTSGYEMPIYRGGSWRYGENYDGAAYRNVYSGAAVNSYAWYGFRVASLAEAPPAVITIDVPAGTQTQTQAGYLSFSGTTPVIKTGDGTLVFDRANTLTGSTTVQGGRLRLADGAALASSLVVPLAGGTLTLSPAIMTTVGGLDPNAGGLTDVGSGMVTVMADLSTADLLTAIVTGRGDGSWLGTSGITSTQAAADVATGLSRAVGWLDNGGGSVSFAFAAAGDTNLDWVVDVLDASNFAASGKYGTGDPATWAEGDFTYDGIVDVLDAAEFASTGLYGEAAYNPPPDSAGELAAVPEPVGTSLLSAAAAAGMWLRRRGRREDAVA